jgi:hypothetical protein
VFCFPINLLSETSLILRKIERDMIKNVYWSSCEVYFCQILMTLVLSRQIFENTQQNFMKILPVGAELFLADGETDIQP